MAIMVSGISLPFTSPAQYAVDQAVKKVGQVYENVYISKKSLDARKREDIRFVYTVAIELLDSEAEKIAVQKINKADVTYKAQGELEISRGTHVLESPPVVVGFGPAGIFAALLLAKEGLRPVVIEQGADVDTRVAQVEGFWSTGALNTRSNVQFGEGGAGTFSDGKLVTRIGDPRCGYVLKTLAEHGAPQEILYEAKPHIGTDRLREVIKSIRREIIRLGGSIRFNTQLTGFGTSNGRVNVARTDKGDFPAGAVVLAPGHSARELFGYIHAMGLPIEAKPFSVGVRIEHLQRSIDQALYGKFSGHPLLPKGEYQLSHRMGGRAVYTFCMCPGGTVVPAASEQGMVVTNGMSAFARDNDNANAALVVSVSSADYGTSALDGVEFQRRLESAAFLAGGAGFKAPCQSVGNFLAGRNGYASGAVKPSYPIGVVGADFENILPEFVTGMLKDGLRSFDKKIAGFAADDAILTGIESRTSSPVRIPRRDDMQYEGIQGIYPCGEGAGYAGGIVSAAVDGIKVAQALLGYFR